MNAFKQHYRPIIDGNVFLALLISGLLAFSSLATAELSDHHTTPEPSDRHTRYNYVFGENPEQRNLSTTVGRQPLLSRLQAISSNTYKVRVIYMIPSDRSAQPNAQAQLKDYVLRMRAWFGEEMARLGYGNKSFLYETDIDGTTPKINIVGVSHPDEYFQGDYLYRWDKILTSIAAAGFPPWTPGELFLVIAETHIQASNGSLLEENSFVGGAGSTFTGVGIVTGEFLARFYGPSFPTSSPFLTDNRPYNGLTIAAVGPYSLVQDVTFPWYEGSTFSSISSSAQGAALHELGEGLWLWHDFRNDDNFNGNFMGNGLRGIRGALYPNNYPNDDTRLSSSSALQLNYNRFFNNGKVFTEGSPPVVDIQTRDVALPINGQCPVMFSASNTAIDSTLAGAVLIKDGHEVAEMPLTGNNVAATIATYDYVPGENNEWLVKVFDTQGNMALSPAISFTCATGYNRAPQPYVRVGKRLIKVGQRVVLDAGRSWDPDGSSSRMKVQWDLNGDGIFDTTSSTNKTYTATYRNQGVYQIIARLTDERNSTSKSIPIGIRVVR